MSTHKSKQGLSNSNSSSTLSQQQHNVGLDHAQQGENLVQQSQSGSASLTSGDILALQNTLGNQAVQRLLHRKIEDQSVSNPDRIEISSGDQHVIQLERDQHGNGCRCSLCARIQRATEENSRVQLNTGTDNTVQRNGDEVVYEEHDFQELLKMWKQKAEKKVEPVSGPHTEAPVYKGPQSAAAVRSLVTSASPSGSSAPAFLAARIKELQGLGISSEVEDQDALIPVLAADMKKKNAMKPPTEQVTLDDEGWTKAAKSQIEGNKTTALTTSDDKYTAIKGGVQFDELHEFIHICSAQGGESALMHFNLNMNEGAINYFSELVAPLVGINLVQRYPPMTEVVKALVATINAQGGDGLKALYDATFKGDVDGFFNAVGDAFVKGDKRPNGKNKGWTDKKWSASDAAEAIKGFVENWSTSNFKNYLL